MSSFLFKLNFFSRTVLQFFLLTKRTIFFLFDLPILWQSSISNVLILTLIWLKISITFSSYWSSRTLSGIPCMPRLLLLLYWSCWFKTVSNTEIWLSALKIQHFLLRQRKCWCNYIKIHFALAFPQQCFWWGWQDFILRDWYLPRQPWQKFWCVQLLLCKFCCKNIVICI